jgi:hypothetical protein
LKAYQTADAFWYAEVPSYDYQKFRSGRAGDVQNNFKKNKRQKNGSRSGPYYRG